MKKILALLTLSLFAFSAHSAEVAKSATEVHPLLLGSKIPNSTVQKLDGKNTILGSFAHGTPTVIVFYRGGWCPYCNRQLSALGQVYPELEKLGFQVIGISPDTPEELSKSLDKNKISYTLLSD